MQFAAGVQGDNLLFLTSALTLDATLTTRAVAAFWLGRCAIVSGGRSARAAADALASLAGELQTADPERSLELGSELLSVTTAFSQLRAGLAAQLQRFRDQARGHPGFEAVARIHSAYEQLLRGEPATAAMEEVQQALATGLPRSAQSNAALLALLALRLGERYELAIQLLDSLLTDLEWSSGQTLDSLRALRNFRNLKVSPKDPPAVISSPSSSAPGDGSGVTLPATGFFLALAFSLNIC